MIEMSVREEDRLRTDTLFPHQTEDPVGIVARIHEKAFLRFFIPGQIAVGLQHANGAYPDSDHPELL